MNKITKLFNMVELVVPGCTVYCLYTLFFYYYYLIIF